MINKIKKQYVKAGIQIVLLVCFTFAISYFSEKSSYTGINEPEVKRIGFFQGAFLILAKIMTLILGSKGLVSAIDNPVQTCIQDKNGSICQEHLSTECNNLCTTNCIPSTSDKVAECTLGTCYDPVEGTCSPRAIKFECEANGGNWSADANGNTPDCRLGCCIVAGENYFVTEKRCSRISQQMQAVKNFSASIMDPDMCYLSLHAEEKGACVLDINPINGKKNCEFTTQAECIQKRGKFSSGFLCSNQDLNTTCERQTSSGCVPGKDEIYWFDSCNNTENIYNVNKDESWNNGRVLAKSQSCTLSSLGNSLSNQGTCGNCDPFLIPGTKCEAKTTTERLDDATQNFVCKRLTCVDEWGKARSNLESWCVYMSSVGVKSDRPSDAVGSMSFTESCVDGKIIEEACSPLRAGICTETTTNSAGQQFSTASCRTNLAELCLGYNFETDKDKMKDDCGKNPDCFLKNISITDTNFIFSFCAPKYTKGASQTVNQDYTDKLCGVATVDCTATRLKTFGGVKWYNQGCLRPEFTEKMNDFCMSLGDCGAKVNYLGDLGSDGYKIKGFGASLPQSYLDAIKTYAAPVLGEYIPASDVHQYLDALANSGDGTTIPADAGSAYFPDNPANWISVGSGMSLGGAGLGIAALLPSTTAPAAGSAVAGVTSGTGAAAAGASAFAAAGGVLAGAAIGAAVVTIFISILGIGAGMPPWLTYSLIGAGAVAGALVGAYLVGATTAAAVPIIGVIILAVVVIIMIVLKLIGVGKKKEYPVTFQCRPWAPPLGGTRCSECGKHGFTCEKYSCEALGTNCEFLNEGTSKEICVNVPSDPNPPQISPLQGVLPEGYSYTNISNLGFQIKSNADDGCIPAFTQVNFGLSLNEPGKCTIDGGQLSRDNLLSMYDLSEQDITEQGIDLSNFQSSELYSSGIYLYNHTVGLVIPSLESLGLSGVDPNVRADLNLHVTCEDKSGNKNTADFIIKSCIRPALDITPPRITEKDPYAGILKAGATEANISIYTNEPANCSYDYSDKGYREMSKNLYCENDISQQKPAGWGCSGTLGITNDTTTIYLRCIDKPWFEGINESARNIMNSSEVFTLTRSLPLNITSIKPNNETLSFGTSPATINAEVRVSGGSDDGNAECGYLFDASNNLYHDFDIGYGTSVQGGIFNQMTEGDKIMVVQCKDSVGNMDTKAARFKIEIDRNPPVITKFYSENGVLTVQTDEKSECAYSTKECSFDFENGTSFGSLDFKHVTNVAGRSSLMYVMCRDQFKNSAGQCSLVVRAG